jgi:quercetin dioxygenase-like cupin family protein
MTDHRIDFEAIPWESPIAGLRQKVFGIGTRQMRLVEYSKALPAHWCEKGHIGYVLQGQIEIRFDAQTQMYGPGDGMFIPDGPEHRHMGTVLSDTVTVVFVEDI